jgi:hypothetical protein
MKNRGGGGRAWSRGSGMGDVVLRGSSSGAPRSRQGGSGPLRSLRQITEQVRGKTVSSRTVAASVRGGRRYWKQLQRGSVAHGGVLGRGDDGVLPRTGAVWHRGSRAATPPGRSVEAHRRGCRSGGVAGSPGRQSSPRPRQLQLRVDDGAHGSARLPSAAARRFLDGTSGAGSKGRLRLLPGRPPLFLPSFFFPLPLLFSGGCDWN